MTHGGLSLGESADELREFSSTSNFSFSGDFSSSSLLELRFCTEGYAIITRFYSFGERPKVKPFLRTFSTTVLTSLIC